MTVRKAVVPVAGFGTRFLPVTRAVPKNALPVFDRPSIHFCVEEAAAAGIEEIIFVVSDNQEAIPRYFEAWPELERALDGRGSSEMLEQMRRISGLARITCVTQAEQKGLGHAVLMARDAVGDEPFAVFPAGRRDLVGRADDRRDDPCLRRDGLLRRRGEGGSGRSCAEPGDCRHWGGGRFNFEDRRDG